MKKIDNIISECINRFLKEEVENSGNMQPTLAWAKAKYTEFNAKYFNNFLPKCTIKVAPLREEGGHLKAGYMKMSHTEGVILYNGANLYANPKTGAYDHIDYRNVYKIMKPVIAINSNYEAPEAALENTLIHEMCHYFNWFNEDGSIRIPDKDNEHHGADFMAAAEMIAQKSGGEVQIKQLINSEDIKTYTASQTFNKGGFKICVADYNGKKLFWYTKYGLWVQFAFHMIGTDLIDVTEDNQVLMLLKRYRYNSTSLKNTKIQAYYVDSAPAELQDAFAKANYTTVTVDDYSEKLGEF